MINFSFDINSEYHACETLHGACKTIARCRFSANTHHVVAMWHIVYLCVCGGRRGPQDITWKIDQIPHSLDVQI